jgi:hypothetical protein
MSVDLVATLARPVTLDAVLRSGRQVLSDILGVAAPALVAFADQQYNQGKCIDQGRMLATTQLSETVIGHRIPAAESELAASIHFKIEVPVTCDGVFVMVIDHQGDAPDEGVHAVFSPYRTCVGVAVATSLALATARVAKGLYIDEQIQMVTSADNDPDDVLDRTRLSGKGDDFAMQCEKYLRQFRHLNGWPEDRAMQ